jgi:hypothetical protein
MLLPYFSLVRCAIEQPHSSRLASNSFTHSVRLLSDYISGHPVALQADASSVADFFEQSGVYTRRLLLLLEELLQFTLSNAPNMVVHAIGNLERYLALQSALRAAHLRKARRVVAQLATARDLLTSLSRRASRTPVAISTALRSFSLALILHCWNVPLTLTYAAKRPRRRVQLLPLQCTIRFQAAMQRTCFKQVCHVHCGQPKN